MDESRRKLIQEVSAALRKDRLKDAAALVAEVGKSKSSDDPKRQEQLVWTLVAWCLENRGYAEAAEILWGPHLFSVRPRQVQMVWRSIEDYAMSIFVGGSSVGKSYSAGAWLILDWIRDPVHTTVRVVGPSEDHLRENLFTHLVSMHREAAIKLPGIIADLFIGMDLRSRKGSIIGTVIPIGKKASGRLQGVKRVQRPGPAHPKFGGMTRMRVFIDEMENVPLGIWADIDNIVANVDGKDGFKLMGAYNPKDPTLQCGIRAEPPEGWAELDDDKEEWISKRGWHVVRLDPEKSENVIAGKTLFPGMQTREGLKLIETNAGGRDSAGYYTFGRGLYPPSGASFAIIPIGLLSRIVCQPLFIERTIPMGGADLALDGGDKPVLAVGLFGLANGIKLPPSPLYPGGHVIYFKDAKNSIITRPCLQLIDLVTLKKGDTRIVAEDIIDQCRRHGIRPGNLCVDRTGAGTGVHDWLRDFYGPDVIGVNYSESCTHRKITEQDKHFCDEIYDRINTELWFAARFWIEFMHFLVDPIVPFTILQEQLGGRYYKPGKKSRIEKKADYKARTGRGSPDEADAVTQLIHSARQHLGEPISMNMTQSSGSSSDEDDGNHVDRPFGCDATNRNDSL